MSKTVGLVLALAALVVGCVTTRPPEIKSMYFGSGTPVPRYDFAQVEVFLRSEPPERPYTTIGEVEISTERKKRSMEEMLNYARVEARKMGGEALIVESESVPTVGKRYPRWNPSTEQTEYINRGPGVRRTLKGAVIVWK